MPLKNFRKFFRSVSSVDGSVRTNVIRSGIWVGAAEIVMAVLSVGRSVALARLLTPEMFGLMGLCSIVIRAIETFTRPGIGQALIQRQASFEEARDTAFTLLLARGIMLGMFLAAAAPLIAWFYEAAELETMLQVLSAIFLIGGFVNINTIAKQKNLDFRSITYLDQVTALLGTIVTVSVAFWLRNVWALVIGQLVTAATYTLLSYYFVSGKPRLTINWKIARELLSYGKFITASSIVLFIATELDTAVIGKLLGTEQLGYYVLAFTIANLVTTNISKVVSKVMMPAYSKLQSDGPALRRAYLRTLSFVMLMVLPAAIGTVVIASPLVRVIYGEIWEQAIVPLQVLAIFGLVRALASFNGYLFEGIGRPDVALRLALLRLAVIAPLIIPMINAYGLRGAAVTVTIGIAVQWGAGLAHISRIVHIGLTDLFVVMVKPLWKSGLMGVGVYALTISIDQMSVGSVAAAIIAGISIYGVLNIQEIKQFVR